MEPLTLGLLAAVSGGAYALWKRARSGGDAVMKAVQRFGAGRKLPCSNLSAAWVLAKLGLTPPDPSSVSSWAALKPSLWLAIQNADWSQPWQGVEEVAKAFGEAPLFAKAGSTPVLDVGKWYFVQRWKFGSGWYPGKGKIDPKKDVGHSYMVQALGDGKYRVVQSGVSLGYRDQTLTSWLPRGYDVGIVEVA